MHPLATAATRIPTGTMSLFAPVAGLREFELTILHGPFLRESIGDPVATQMIIWGDIDQNCNEKIAPTEATSKLLPYVSRRQLVLSAGPGTKTVNVRLRNDNGLSVPMTGTLTVGTTPHTSLVWSAYRRGNTLFGWTVSHACTAYRFRLLIADSPGADSTVLTSGGALTAGQYVEISVPPQTDLRYVVLVMEIQVGGVWY